MNPVIIRNIKIGEGVPKICVPIIGRTQQEIVEQAKALKETPADIAEWRADWFEDVYDREKVCRAAEVIRHTIADMPLLFTFRTAKEGGQKEIGAKEYENINIAVAQSGIADLIDMEAFFAEAHLPSIIEKIHAQGAKVIASNHDFLETPTIQEILRRLCHMQDAGADIIKIAVMPRQKQDVLTLLEATGKMTAEYAACPMITMSMAGTGVISRLCGETFGSAVTFASVGKASSAPGQIDVFALKDILQILHQSCQI